MWSEEQNTIIHSKTDVKQIIAAAGSGKTAIMVGMLVEKQKNEGFTPEKILVVTFTKKATREFKERCIKHSISKKVHISTFHSFCYFLLKQFHPYFQNRKFKLLSENKKWQVTKEILYPYRYKIGGLPFSILTKNQNEVLKNISASIVVDYEKKLNSFKDVNAYFEFEDLPFRLLEYLDSNPNQNIFSMFSELIIDEFQDTDLTQMQIIQKLKFQKITVVGDDWQAIYGFRGADPKQFLEFSTYFPHSQKLFLSTNYRSLKSVIKTSILSLQKNKNQIHKKIKHSRIGKTIVKKIYVSSAKENLLSKFQYFAEKDPNLKILVRSNFRKREWFKMGIPEKYVQTIHSAKGLEYETVLVDLVSGWSRDTKKTNIEEERRILYVALSRAKDNLVLLLNERAKQDTLLSEFVGYFSIAQTIRNLALRLLRFW
ncbi:UvrD-helicase domain-containing protein [Leptospira sp. 96542]|nr:UvrD-helicase domain-containing protein [Leptospira sp. 96542]